MNLILMKYRKDWTGFRQGTVTYTGTVSEVDPFSGTILSVQKQ